MKLSTTYSPRKLRIMLRNPEKRYADRLLPEHIPEELVPHVQRAIDEIELSGNPTQSRTYEVGDGTRLSVYYKPSRGSYWKDIPKDARAGRDARRYRVRYRTWP